MDENTIVARERLFIPVHLIDETVAKKKYVHRFYEEAVCRRCDNRPDRHNDVCQRCDSYKGKVLTAKRMIKGDTEYMGIPLGDRRNVRKFFGINMKKADVLDLRTRFKRRYKVKTLPHFKPFDYQAPAIVNWTDAGFGILKAPPRSGKTPMMLYMGINNYDQRFVVIADQKEFLDQFLDHVVKYTNLPALEKKYGKKLFGYARKPEDFENFEIAVCTYQTFLSEKGQKLFKLLNKNYGLAFVDEVHSSGATKYSEQLNELRMRWRFGATGTDDRKDGKYKVVMQIMGPVTALVERPQLTANVYVHPMDFVKSRAKYVGKAGFSHCVNFLSKHEKRNVELLKWVRSDLDKGHCIVIPCMRKEHIMELVKRINNMMGEKIAEPFVGGAKNKKDLEYRKMVLERARSRKTRVIVGIKSLLQRGLNVPAWSMLYYILPMNNEPNWKQESSRILTPDDSGLKRTPGIRMFVDPNIGLSLGCFVSTYKLTLKFKHKPTEVAHERALLLMAQKNRERGGRDDDDGEFGAPERTSPRSARPFG